jgi:hypothetical protein
MTDIRVRIMNYLEDQHFILQPCSLGRIQVIFVEMFALALALEAFDQFEDAEEVGSVIGELALEGFFSFAFSLGHFGGG